jgi:hypothetical protein
VLNGNFEAKWLSFQERLTAIIETPRPPESFVQSEMDVAAGFELSSEARTLLVATSKDERGKVIRKSSNLGMSIFANGVLQNERGNSRSEAFWIDALDQLVGHELLRPNTPGGDVFSLTAEGYRIADALASSSAIDAEVRSRISFLRELDRRVKSMKKTWSEYTEADRPTQARKYLRNLADSLAELRTEYQGAVPEFLMPEFDNLVNSLRNTADELAASSRIFFKWGMNRHSDLVDFMCKVAIL